MDSSSMHMGTDMKEVGLTTRSKERGRSHTQMVQFMKEIFWMTIQKVRVCSAMQMETNMKDNGRRESSVDSER